MDFETASAFCLLVTGQRLGLPTAVTIIISTCRRSDYCYSYQNNFFRREKRQLVSENRGPRKPSPACLVVTQTCQPGTGHDRSRCHLDLGGKLDENQASPEFLSHKRQV